jgi:hypothetical protein
VAAELEPGAGGRNVVGGALALHLKFITNTGVSVLGDFRPFLGKK